VEVESINYLFMPVREIENEQNTGISDVDVMYKYLGI